MLGLALASVLSTVGAEPVEARDRGDPVVARSSASSGRTTRDSVVDAERAFDTAAARDGQWTAFRAFADPGAIMFVPRPINAPAWLKGRADPPRSVRWQPAAAYVACDGRWAVTTGAWQGPGGGRGYFTTVWHRDASGLWRWVLDHGDASASPRPAPARPIVRHAGCGGKGRATNTPSGADTGVGASDDATLRWRYAVAADGARRVGVDLWTGERYDPVVDDRVAAPPNSAAS